MRVNGKRKARRGFDPKTSDIPLGVYFEPIIIFANGKLETDRPEAVKRMLWQYWSPYREAIYDLPDWIYHQEALKPKKRLSMIDYFMVTNDSGRDRIFKRGVRQEKSLATIRRRGIKNLVEFQTELKTRLHSMFNPKVAGTARKNWAKYVGDAWYSSTPVYAEVKYLPFAKQGYPAHGIPSFLLMFADFQSFLKYLLAQLINQGLINRLKACRQCEQFYFVKTSRGSKYCGDRCRFKDHNKRKIDSGYLKQYMRWKRADGKYQ